MNHGYKFDDKNTKTKESASLEFQAESPFPELSCERSTTNNTSGSERPCTLSLIVNSSSAVLSLWDTSGCSCALLWKVLGNCCGCGANPCAFLDYFQSPLAWQRDRNTVSSRGCVRAYKWRQEGEDREEERQKDGRRMKYRLQKKARERESYTRVMEGWGISQMEGKKKKKRL